MPASAATAGIEGETHQGIEPAQDSRRKPS